MKVPNRDTKGKDLTKRSRCCKWCKGDKQCMGRKIKKKWKRWAVKKLRRFIKEL